MKMINLHDMCAVVAASVVFEKWKNKNKTQLPKFQVNTIYFMCTRFN